ncbi:unannotated protein [freshwater metagenome]|uniref:Unannotated protein n=1 Tax=freshwater metagenome TaxID=449393 RepID=A0A6J6ZVK1_9ZZZZ
MIVIFSIASRPRSSSAKARGAGSNMPAAIRTWCPSAASALAARRLRASRSARKSAPPQRSPRPPRPRGASPSSRNTRWRRSPRASKSSAPSRPCCSASSMIPISTRRTSSPSPRPPRTMASCRRRSTNSNRNGWSWRCCVRSWRGRGRLPFELMDK